jgi:hypothetical protein
VGLEAGKPIITGKFVDIERPSYLGTMNQHLSERLGERYNCTEELTCQ